MGFFNFNNLFNRRPNRTSGVFIPAESGAEDAKAKKPTSDPLANLTKKSIKTDLRNEINKGLFARPAWTFHELARTCSELGDKVSFWQSKIGALPWSIRVDKDSKKWDEATRKKAEEQRQALKTRYDNIKNLRKAIRHMATARFYGFAVVMVQDGLLVPIDPWNVIHDVEWRWNEAPTYRWHFNQKAENKLKKDTMPVMEIGEYAIRESDECNMVSLMLLALRTDANTDFRDKNLEEASKNQVIILTGDKLPDPETEPKKYNDMIAALKDARAGKSAVIAKGDPECPTEVIKPTAAAGLPYYNETLDKLDQLMTKAVTGGLLTMLSMDTGIGNGASDNHADTLADILEDDAKGICEAFWEAIDRPTLEAAGLLQPGERQLAWFDLGLPDRKDSAKAAETLSTLRSAKYNVSDEQASDMLGFDVESEWTQKTAEPEPGKPAPAASGEQNPAENGGTKPQPDVLALANRAKSEIDRRAIEADFNKGFMAFLDELEEATGQAVPDEDWRKKIMDAIQSADPATLADSEALRKYLEKKILKGLRDGEPQA